jgi:hypothetical protein
VDVSTQLTPDLRDGVCGHMVLVVRKAELHGTRAFALDLASRSVQKGGVVGDDLARVFLLGEACVKVS